LFVALEQCLWLFAGSEKDSPTLRRFGALENYKKLRLKRDVIKPLSLSQTENFLLFRPAT
jgi:hypothetical protein